MEQQITQYNQDNVWLGTPNGEGRWATPEEVAKLRKCFRCEFLTLNDGDYHNHLAQVHRIMI